MALVTSVNEIFAAKGKKVVHVDLRQDKPSEEALKSLLLGPTGNLRAPTIRAGKTLVVGFNEELYQRVFGG
jgi:arsenate reductase-like glutaredoxin family protein